MTAQEAQDILKHYKSIKLHPADTRWKWIKKQLEEAKKRTVTR